MTWRATSGGPSGEDLTLFPFDTQFCELQYGSVADSARRVNYTLMGPGNPYRDSVGLEGPIISSVSFDVTAVGGRACTLCQHFFPPHLQGGAGLSRRPRLKSLTGAQSAR